MKLGKLLAAGKSIMNGHTDISYRSSKQIYLPKFGSAKNPFKSDAPGLTAETIPSPAPTVAKEPCVSTNAPAAIDKKAPATTRLPARVASPGEPPEGHGSVPHREIGTASNGMSNGEPSATVQHKANAKFEPQSVIHNSLSENASTLQRFNALVRSALGKARPSDKSAKNQKATATQTELSLDSVKVVHNDLSDVDVEIVPIKSRSGAPELPAPKKSWEYVGERLFGVEAT